MKPNLVELKEALVSLAQTIRQPGWDFDTIDYQLTNLQNKTQGFERQLREHLKAEQQNHENAMAMPTDGEEREDLLAHSWGRIQILKQILGEKP